MAVLTDIPAIVWVAAGSLTVELLRRVFAKEDSVSTEGRTMRGELREENKQLRSELEAVKIARDLLHTQALNHQLRAATLERELLKVKKDKADEPDKN